MWVYADDSQVVGKLKERNRYVRAFTEIREIGVSVYNKESSSEVEESLILIAQKCEHALKPVTQITDNSVTIVSLQAVNSR